MYVFIAFCIAAHWKPRQRDPLLHGRSADRKRIDRPVGHDYRDGGYGCA